MKSIIKRIVPYSNITSLLLVIVSISTVIVTPFVSLPGIFLIMLYELFNIFRNKKFIHLIAIDLNELYIEFIKRYAFSLIILLICTIPNFIIFEQYFSGVPVVYISVLTSITMLYIAGYLCELFISGFKPISHTLKYALIFIFSSCIWFVSWFTTINTITILLVGASLIILNYNYMKYGFKIKNYNKGFELVLITYLSLIIKFLTIASILFMWNIYMCILCLVFTYIMIDIFNYLYSYVVKPNYKLIGICLVIIESLVLNIFSPEVNLIIQLFIGLFIIFCCIFNLKLTKKFIRMYNVWL